MLHGEVVETAVFSEADIHRVDGMRAAGNKVAVIADRHGVSKSTVLLRRATHLVGARGDVGYCSPVISRSIGLPVDAKA